MGTEQVHFKFGVNTGPSADPDDIVFGALNTDLTDQDIDTPLHIRIQVGKYNG